MTVVKNAPAEIDLTKYNELEQYMPRQVVLAQSHDRNVSEANSEIPTPMKGIEIYESLIASVKTSSLAIRELARVKQELTLQNHELQVQHEQLVSELRENLVREQSRAGALEIEMKTLKGAYEHRLEESSAHIQQLESHNTFLADQLKKQADQVAELRGILDHLVGELADELSESLRESNAILQDLR